MKKINIYMVVSIVLILVGFFAPPLGFIDNSVLVAVGLLVMLSVINKLPKEGVIIRFQKGDMTGEISTTKSDSIEMKSPDK